MGTYKSTKTYCHNQGLSVCFRQWRAKSHCQQLHGYALEIRLTFECTVLDENGWVQDFGGLKYIKGWLEDMFDHRLLVAADDPQKAQLLALGDTDPQIAWVIEVPQTGCEAFARYIYDYVEQWLSHQSSWPRVLLHSVEVREHQGNSAIYERASK